MIVAEKQSKGENLIQFYISKLCKWGKAMDWFNIWGCTGGTIILQDKRTSLSETFTSLKEETLIIETNNYNNVQGPLEVCENKDNLETDVVNICAS